MRDWPNNMVNGKGWICGNIILVMRPNIRYRSLGPSFQLGLRPHRNTWRNRISALLIGIAQPQKYGPMTKPDCSEKNCASAHKIKRSALHEDEIAVWLAPAMDCYVESQRIDTSLRLGKFMRCGCKTSWLGGSLVALCVNWFMQVKVYSRDPSDRTQSISSIQCPQGNFLW